MAVKIDPYTADSWFDTNSAPMVEGIQSFQYPLTIQNEEDRHTSYLVFYAVETGNLLNKDIDERSIASIQGRYEEKTKAVIQLYMPNMVENIQHTYQTDEGGFIKDFVTNTPELMNSPGMSDAMTIGGGLLSTIADKMIVKAAQVTGQYNAQITGNVLGGRSAQMYKNSAPRQQTFAFQLRPRNISELREVGQILKTFMIYSAATQKGAASFKDIETSMGYSVLEVPPLWFVEERINTMGGNSGIRHTPKFAMGPAAITNIRINKTPDQLYETFEGTAGDSVAIDLEITLTELRLVHSDYYRALTADLGSEKQDSGKFMFESFAA